MRERALALSKRSACDGCPRHPYRRWCAMHWAKGPSRSVPAKCKRISTAAGRRAPLFAVELARHHDEMLALPLRVGDQCASGQLASGSQFAARGGKKCRWRKPGRSGGNAGRRAGVIAPANGTSSSIRGIVVQCGQLAYLYPSLAAPGNQQFGYGIA